MKLFFSPGTIALASAYTLEEAGLDYEPVQLDFPRGEQTKPEYLALNPKGRVPALVTDHGILTETGAVLEYVASLAPDRGLVPDDPWQAAQMRSALYYLASTVHVNHAHKHRGSRWATQQASFDDMTAKVSENMAACCRFIEDNWPLSSFAMGPALSVADPYLFAVCTWLEGDNVAIADYPKLAAHFDMMRQRPAAAAVRAKGFMR